MSHHRELVNPPELHPAPGFSHVALARGTKVVHFAGQLGLAPDFSLVADDLYGQTVGAMRNLEQAMDAVGVRWDDVVRRTIYTLHPTEYETIKTIVGITGLAVPGCLIEIECTAVLDESERG
jgi:enamine deaminase RidA (YjgF/YER057c/UK114 family)